MTPLTLPPRIRKARREEGDVAFACYCACHGFDRKHKVGFDKEWECLTSAASETAIHIVAEADIRYGTSTVARTRLLGHAAGLFVSKDFHQYALASQDPYIRLWRAHAEGINVYVTKDELAAANIGSGALLWLTHWAWAEDVLDPDGSNQVQLSLIRGFADELRGFRLASILFEVLGEQRKMMCEAFGFQLVREWVAEEPGKLRPYLMAADPKSIQSVPNTAPIWNLFDYYPPNIFLTDLERAVVLASDRGTLSNREIGLVIGKSESSVENALQRIYKKAGAAYQPDKRRVIDEICANPSNLRPHHRPRR